MEIEIRGRKFEVRGLTHNEIRQIKQAGYDFLSIEMEVMADSEPILTIFNWTCPELDIDELTPGETMGVLYKIIELTFARPEFKGEDETSTKEDDAEKSVSETDAGSNVH